ncbi:hypothetical protein E4100_06660 [Soehngenia longivitae]|uniref:Uncharacterized protein n=1 Tax=Soehngenia longivitae TaxID=2562294 RepID=A0A4Z0D2F9_9FIRM|nr:hypothetical protein [Soehngenia longivitae]TFZ39940.1 hypothetical protein E4100_06660 [Soehngenia longivitae]
MRVNVFIPLGVGVLLAAILMNFSYGSLSDKEIEIEARKLGMIYPEEIKVNINSNENNGGEIND